MKKIVIISFLLITISYGAQSTSLMEVYQLATINDPFIKEALANKEAIIESKPQARSLILPQLSSSATFSDSDVNGQSTFQQKFVNPITGDESVITSNTDFIQKYIFPGGFLPSIHALKKVVVPVSYTHLTLPTKRIV